MYWLGCHCASILGPIHTLIFRIPCADQRSTDNQFLVMLLSILLVAGVASAYPKQNGGSGGFGGFGGSGGNPGGNGDNNGGNGGHGGNGGNGGLPWSHPGPGDGSYLPMPSASGLHG